MAIVVQTASAAVVPAGTNGAGSASPLSASISPPTGLAAGDTWIIVAVDDWGSGSSWSTPTGFTKQSTAWNDGAGQNVGVTLWYKPNCTGSETAVTITDTVAGQNIMLTALSWRHSSAATGTPFVDISDGSASVAIAAGTATKSIATAASHTPTQAGEVVYVIAAQAAGATTSGGVTWTTPSGWTLLKVADHDTAARNPVALGGDFTSMAVFYQVQTTATGTGTPSSTATFPGNAPNNGGGLAATISFYAAASGTPTGTGTVANTDSIAGSGVVLVPASGSTLANTNSLAGTATILKPSGAATVAGVGAVSGAGTILVPAPSATVAELGALAGGGAVLVPAGAAGIGNVNALASVSIALVVAPPGTVSTVNSIAGTGVVLVPAPSATVADVNALAGSGVVLVPSGVTTLASRNTLAGGGAVLTPAPVGTLTNSNSLAGSGVVLVPSGIATFANTNSLINSGASFVAAPSGTVGNANALSGLAAVLVPSGTVTLAGLGALSGSGVVLVPSGSQTIAGAGVISAGTVSLVASATVGTLGGIAGSGVVLVPSGAATFAGVGALFGRIGPVILSFYVLYRANPRPNLYRAGSRISRYTAAPRRNLYRAKGAVGMSALQDSGQQNCLLRVGELNQPYLMDFKTVPLGTGEHVTACSVVIKQVTDTTSTDVTSALCPVQPGSGDIANDVVTAYLNGAAATVGAKYKVIYYATTNATRQPSVRVEDISFVQCDE